MNAYFDMKRSILFYLNEFITRNGFNNTETFDFDAHSVIKELPPIDLVGIGEYSIQNAKDLHTVTCMIIVCTTSTDDAIKRLTNIVGALYQELVPGSSGDKFKIVDERGAKVGYMTIIEDVMVTAVGATKTRPMQAIAVSFGAGYTREQG